jgi:hypothetical protein
MAQNRVQYLRGLSMPVFFECYGVVQRCEALVRLWRWPQPVFEPEAPPTSRPGGYVLGTPRRRRAAR